MTSTGQATLFHTTQTTYVYYDSTRCSGGTWNGYLAYRITSIADTWVRSSSYDQLVSATYNAGNIGHQCNGAVNLQSTGSQTIYPTFSGNTASWSRTLNYNYDVLNGGDSGAEGHWMKAQIHETHLGEYGYACSWVYLQGVFIDCP